MGYSKYHTLERGMLEVTVVLAESTAISTENKTHKADYETQTKAFVQTETATVLCTKASL